MHGVIGHYADADKTDACERELKSLVKFFLGQRSSGWFVWLGDRRVIAAALSVAGHHVVSDRPGQEDHDPRQIPPAIHCLVPQFACHAAPCARTVAIQI